MRPDGITRNIRRIFVEICTNFSPIFPKSTHMQEFFAKISFAKNSCIKNSCMLMNLWRKIVQYLRHFPCWLGASAGYGYDYYSNYTYPDNNAGTYGYGNYGYGYPSPNAKPFRPAVTNWVHLWIHEYTCNPSIHEYTCVYMRIPKYTCVYLSIHEYT